MVNIVNYIIMAIGIIVILAASILILMDKLKGEDVYFNIDVKEQELKKVLEDADDVISEINYISEVVVKEMEDKIESLQEVYKAAKILNIPTYEQLVQSSQQQSEIKLNTNQNPTPKENFRPIQQPIAETPAPEVTYQPLVPQAMQHKIDSLSSMSENRKEAASLTKEGYEKKTGHLNKQEKNEKSNTKQKAVFDYVAQGLSISEIAKKMNMGQGEVMLILSIKNEV